MERELALITGASSGIGLELAKQFARNGFDVVIAAEDQRLAGCVPELRALGAEVLPVQVDLATYDGVEQLVAAVADTNRPLAALALNAGVGVGGEFVETSLQDDLNLIALNVSAVVHLAKRLLPDMVRRQQGRVLVTASLASTMPGPYYATYAASKAFVLSFAEAIRYELQDRGVSVTALMPGATDTDFFRRADMLDTPAGEGPKDDPAEVAADGFAAMMAGDDHVVAGAFKNKVQATAAKVMPEAAKSAVHARQTEPT
jgi:short-subunit dehydrogenase